jgi:hypothetical protein
MDVDHPPFTPLLERWVDLLEPVELKRQRATEKTRASLLKEISSVTPIMLERDLTGERSLTPTFNVSELTAGQRLYARLLKYTPEAARQIPVRQKGTAVFDGDRCP